jgi:hypothetical protein
VNRTYPERTGFSPGRLAALTPLEVQLVSHLRIRKGERCLRMEIFVPRGVTNLSTDIAGRRW